MLTLSLSQPDATRRSPLKMLTQGTWSRTAGKPVAALVAGSGVLNLLSLLGRSRHATQPVWLSSLFPLDFTGVARSATLLLGFALILAGIHLISWKRRAWILAGVLSIGSAGLHLSYLWNPKEAAFSLLIAATLWFCRDQFQVGADKPQLASAAMRAGAAFSVAGLYGAVGFWLLERRDFHHNFPWWDAGLHAVRFLLLSADDSLIPRTHYAEWFLNSLFLMSVSAFLYSGLVLFRPVSYRFRQDQRGAALAEVIAAEYGSSAQDFFKHGPDKTYFFSQTRRSFLSYRVARHYALVLGDPVGPEDEWASTIAEFVHFCRSQGWRVGFHQVGSCCLAMYEAHGFRKIRVGEDAIVDLNRFSLEGSSMKEFRNTVNRLSRLGYRVERINQPLSTAILTDLEQISNSWLDIPGHRERQFTLGRFDPSYLQNTPVYVAYDAEDEPVAFLNLVPSYQDGLSTVDLMRRRPNAVNGLMDFLFAKVFLDLKQRGVQRFSLGMAPLTDSDKYAAASVEEHIVRWLMKKLPFLFRSDSLRRFKAKYAHEWLPRYAVYESRLDLPRLGLALRQISELPQPRGRAA